MQWLSTEFDMSETFTLSRRNPSGCYPKERDCAKLNELRAAYGRAVAELMIYVNKTGAIECERYRLLLGDVERTSETFNAFARTFVKSLEESTAS